MQHRDGTAIWEVRNVDRRTVLLRTVDLAAATMVRTRPALEVALEQGLWRRVRAL